MSEIPDRLGNLWHGREDQHAMTNRMIADLDGVIRSYIGAVSTLEVLGALRACELRWVDRWWGIVNPQEKSDGEGVP